MLRRSQKKDKPQTKTTPWDEWKLDKAFFKALSQYSIDHPETTLDRVLEKIRIGLDNNKELFELIPESPFPARGLVKALAHLLKLGVTVSRAKLAAYEFATQVVTWVLDIKLAFEMSSGGRFTWMTWKNLEKMRNLVDEVCVWANTRLNDKRWSRIGNGMMIGNEIVEFNARIADARALFRDLTTINLSGGIDAMLTAIRMILLRQDNITREINKIKKKQAEQFSYIIDEFEAQNQAQARRMYLSQTLSLRVVATPTYDQQGKNPCDEDTRTEVLAEIMQWIHNISSSSENFLWLTGDPGCGKSAITASIARECKDEGILWAQFFINRNNVETTDPNSYFPSIARQLVDQSPDVERAVYDALKKKPSLMDRISPEQAAKLFVDAIGVASKLYPQKSVVIVIDGLDETDRKRLKDTAIIFSYLFKDLSSYRNVKVFVSSRTEDDIRNPFARTMNDKNVKHVHLDTSAQSSIEDVSAFLRRKMARIVEENDLNWVVWPGEQRMTALAARASGLFIWAVTVAKFLQEQIETLGTECLNDVLDMLTAEALSDINTLYSIILRLTHKDTASDWEFEKFRRIVGAIVVLREPLCLEDLTSLLNLRQPTSGAPADINNFFRRLRTVLVAGTDAISNKTVPRLHKSFFEFITSSEVDSRFHINPDVADGELALQCFRQFRNARLVANQPTVNSVLPGQLRYACRFWSTHFHQAMGATSGVVIANTELSLHNFQKLLQFSSTDKHRGHLDITFSRNKSQILMSWDDHVRTWDTMSGHKIQITLKGHTHQVVSVTFSPDGNRVVSGSIDNTLILWDSRTGERIGPPFKAHSGGVRAVAFSPMGNRIASGSDDTTICLWDTQIFQPVMSLTGHRGAVRCVAFSPNRTHLISGSDDKTLRMWDIEDGHLIRILSGHTEPIWSVAFSPDGNQVISGSLDSTARLWSIEPEESIGRRLPHTQRVWSVVFSPDGKQIASSYGYGNDAICIWDVESEQVMSAGPPFQDSGRVRCLAFSPDGMHLVCGSDDHKIHMVDSRTRQSIVPPFIGHTGSVSSVAFSPTGRQIASGSEDQTVYIWDVPGQALPRNGSETTSTSFSPDGTLVVSLFSDNTIRLSDSRAVLPVGRALQGTKGQISCTAFSPDNTRFAAASVDGTISLWDTMSYQLIPSSVKALVYGVISMYFMPDNRTLITTCSDATIYTWKEVNGRLCAPQLSTLDPESNVPLYPGITDTSDSSHLKGVRWYPTNKHDSGLWAFIDSHIIRARDDGSITVVSVS